jgi:hypothetical protein
MPSCLDELTGGTPYDVPHFAVDQETRFQIAQDSVKARAKQESDTSKYRDLNRVDRGERAQDASLLFGQAVVAQRRRELPHHGLAGAQQRHRQ